MKLNRPEIDSRKAEILAEISVPFLSQEVDDEMWKRATATIRVWAGGGQVISHQLQAEIEAWAEYLGR